MRVVLTGASGQLGSSVVAALVATGHEVSAWSGSDTGRRGDVALRPMDLTNLGAIRNALEDADPEVVIHAAALSSADAVRNDPALGYAVNVEATAALAAWCGERDRRIIYTSTDMVFDGSKAWWNELDRAEPILQYGRLKLEAEAPILAVSRGLVTRISLLYGPSRSGRETYVERTLQGLRSGVPQTFFEDEFRTPLDLETAGKILVLLAERDAVGLLHVAGPERLSRFDLVRRQAEALGLDTQLVRANRQADVTLAEPRPADISMDTSRLRTVLPDLTIPTVEQTMTAPR